VAVLALGTGWLGHLLINWAHAHVSIMATSLLTLLTPLVAMAGAALLLDEPVVAVQVVGLVVVLGSLAMVVAPLSGRGRAFAAADSDP
jgi:drug/metabolite transporter (DMT)-like permease